MAPFPDEVDVFTGPHWRMKQLVGLYCDKLSNTNFSNNSDFRSFLQSLCDTFKEFKMHEQIENEFIIGQLQQRSRTVYNVHSDNKLSEMLSLFEKGLRSVKSEYEQLNYARQLKERLEAFTQDFLPHMKEEEEVFQPMLMEYFTYEELKDIKKQVIAQHSRQQRWGCAVEVLKGFSLFNQAEELHKAFKYSDHEKTDDELERGSASAHISQLPVEVLLKIFQFLGPEDLCRCGQVSATWASVTKTGSLWRHLYPVRWARGDYYHGPPGELEQEPDEEWVSNRQDEGKAYQEWDEDADVDESEKGSDESSAYNAVQREKKLLNGMIQNLLPAVGPSVRSITLAYSFAVSSKMVRQILSLCPNLTYLDLTQTDVTDSAFDSWASLAVCSSLEHLDLSGCEKITDHTLKTLALGMGDLASTSSSSSSLHRGSPERRAKLLASHPSPIKLQHEAPATAACPVLGPGGRQALIFKRRPGGRGNGCGPAHVWVLDPDELVDIEDAAEWSRRGGVGMGVGVGGGPSVSVAGPSSRPVEVQAAGGQCCCRVSRSQSFRTGNNSGSGGCNALYWQQVQLQQQQQASYRGAPCGHSTCCGRDTALRTSNGPQQPQYCPMEAGGSTEFRTKCPMVGQQDTCPGHEQAQTGKSDTPRSLRFLSLSGCYQVTDLGLRALSQRGGLPVLEHLNLSGCLMVTEVGLQELVTACPSLNDEHFYYCDNINGPHADTASGCQNLQCGFRACCRSGE
ncbi:F-box/LRR-repeat protein 5 isoform X2 [Engraulis encrasicolus]|uniref:F-box/LRR-repeat protein 5 isoform X2 n=1 Tax=Engraulis encrasicolus TaxID=184585 RepID=UPI002FD6D586